MATCTMGSYASYSVCSLSIVCHLTKIQWTIIHMGILTKSTNLVIFSFIWSRLELSVWCDGSRSSWLWQVGSHQRQVASLFYFLHHSTYKSMGFSDVYTLVKSHFTDFLVVIHQTTTISYLVTVCLIWKYSFVHVTEFLVKLLSFPLEALNSTDRSTLHCHCNRISFNPL